MPVFRIKLPPAPPWAFAVVAFAAFGFLLRVYIGIWTPEHGITKFLRVGREFNERGTQVFRATPKFIDPYPAHRWGFDGQLYAEMALDPLLRDPRLRVALDDPSYRGQRILLSWLAWALGLGKPFWVLNAFAALNLIFWIGFAWLAARLFRPHGWAGLAGYAAILLTCGALESMHSSLTDLPSFTLILAALMVGGTAGAGILALAALARTTSLIGFVGLADFTPPWREALRRNLLRGLIATVPIGLWVAYVVWRFWGREVALDGGNLDWPLRGMMEKLGEFTVTAAHGSIRWHRWFVEIYKNYDFHALLTIIAVLTQSIYLALHRDWRDPLWRWGAATVIYFSCISFLSWESHFTITRHALPMTLGFNLLLARGGGPTLAAAGRRSLVAWLIWFLLGNCFVPFGVRYFDEMREYRSPEPPPEFVVAEAAGRAPPIGIKYARGWSPQQWSTDSTWRWARGGSAVMLLRNHASHAVTAELRFIARTHVASTLEVKQGDAPLLREHLAPGRHVMVLEHLTLPPGETRLTFANDAEPSASDDGTPGRVTFKLENPHLTVAAP